MTENTRIIFIKRTFFLIVLFLGLYAGLSSQVIKTIEVSFERVTLSPTVSDTVRGRIYYKEPDDLKFHIDYPVNQWMIFAGKQLDIYYPGEKVAYRINSRFPTTMPFFQAFVGVVKEDYGLTEMGYEMSGYETTGDTLKTRWQPPEMAEKLLGPYRLDFCNDKIIYAELTDGDGAVTARSYYMDHFKSGAAWFPLTIKTVQYTERDSTVEWIHYHDPQFDRPLPEEAVKFRIPDNVTVVESEW